MEGLYKNKFRIPSIRLQNYDYSGDGYYFVTICTKNREHFFGNVVNKEMVLNGLGQIAVQYWLEIPKHFPNVILDEFVIMPNHIHGIIIIENKNAPVETQHCCVSVPQTHETNETQHCCVSTTTPTTTTTMDDNKSRTFYKLKLQSLSVIVRSFKSIITKIINNPESFWDRQTNFQWQPRFYEHIIRNEESLHRIKEYILNNPENWERDKNNSENLVI